MNLRFEGPPPGDAEIAAIVAVLQMPSETTVAQSDAPSAWQLSARFPDLDIDELRALARSRPDVF